MILNTSGHWNIADDLYKCICSPMFYMFPRIFWGACIPARSAGFELPDSRMKIDNGIYSFSWHIGFVVIYYSFCEIVFLLLAHCWGC